MHCNVLNDVFAEVHLSHFFILNWCVGDYSSHNSFYRHYDVQKREMIVFFFNFNKNKATTVADWVSFSLTIRSPAATKSLKKNTSITRQLYPNKKQFDCKTKKIYQTNRLFWRKKEPVFRTHSYLKMRISLTWWTFCIIKKKQQQQQTTASHHLIWNRQLRHATTWNSVDANHTICCNVSFNHHSFTFFFDQVSKPAISSSCGKYRTCAARSWGALVSELLIYTQVFWPKSSRSRSHLYYLLCYYFFINGFKILYFEIERDFAA